MKYLILCFAVLFCGCPAQPRTLEYSWGSIIATDGNSLTRRCSDSPGKWDNGRPKMFWDPVAGCMVIKGKNDKPEYWIEDNDYGWRCALGHELAHGDGIDNPEAAGYGCK